MLKLGIETLLGCNYGNRLQNYALQELLRGLGCEVETLRDISDTCLAERLKYVIKYIVKKDFRKTVQLGRKAQKHNKPYSRVRRAVFSRWDKKYITFSEFKFSKYHYPANLGQMYDCFIAGSDQIWNPYFVQDNLMLLSFAPPEKRISYAASFGVADFPEHAVENYKNELVKFKAISVREEDAVRLVGEISGMSAVRLIDPTMVLTIDEWRAVEARPKWLTDGAYVLLYSLGGVPEPVREFANKIAGEHGLAVYEIFKQDDKTMHTIDPFEFVYLIDNAQLVITDSFHGTVFSILSKTPFTIFGRGDTEVNMSSRFDTLLSLFPIKNRMYSASATYESVMDCDFSETDGILAAERADSKRFLTENLGL